MFFGNNEKGATPPGAKQVNSALGREITTTENAKAQYYKKSTRRDPRDFINKISGLNYYGHSFGEVKDEAVYIPDDETTMELYVGPTGTGKGVFLGNKALEAMQRGRGLIIIDPKQDNFLPQICKEELTRQGRPDDLQVLNWPTNFGYTGISEKDNYVDIANKLIDAFDLIETGDGGVDHYRENGRIILKKILKIFFTGKLGVKVKKDLLDIAKHARHLKEDLEKEELLNKELSKTRPLPNLVLKYEKRFFDKAKVEAVYWDSTTIETLDSLAKKMMEMVEGGNIFNEYTLDGALYEGKVLYVKCDMLDRLSLKLVKLMMTDAIQKARRKKADTTIIADELSFYCTPTFSGALATVRSFGLLFINALQALEQMPDDLRSAVQSNCNVQLFYKTANAETFKYIESIGGNVAITKYRTGEGGYAISQDVEPLLNATKIRALPRAGVGVLIAEYLNTPVVIQTSFVAVEKLFDWEEYEKPEFYDLIEDEDDEDEESIDISIQKTDEENTEENGDEEDF